MNKKAHSNCFGSGSFFMFKFMEHGFRSAFYTQESAHFVYFECGLYFMLTHSGLHSLKKKGHILIFHTDLKTKSTFGLFCP